MPLFPKNLPDPHGNNKQRPGNPFHRRHLWDLHPTQYPEHRDEPYALHKVTKVPTYSPHIRVSSVPKEFIRSGGTHPNHPSERDSSHSRSESSYNPCRRQSSLRLYPMSFQLKYLIFKMRPLSFPLLSQKGPGDNTLYSLRMSKGFRGVAYRAGSWLRLLSLHPDHDSAYR